MKDAITHALLALAILLPLPAFGLDGKCIDGDCQNGQGTWEFRDGSRFVGGWKDGKRHGQVLWISAKGDTDSREYRDGARLGKCLEGDCFNGTGLIMYSDESIYVGEFVEGHRQGEGKWSKPAGPKYEGTWTGDEITGTGTMTYPDGSFYTGGVREGKQQGRGTYTYTDG
ncbi:MAG TPA: hypothetical protein VLA15_04830, partial [Desulfurivibrionaceae bacterium]|nr:hypothetical protein [Desulfurivibrionaceae bacterium]